MKKFVFTNERYQNLKEKESEQLKLDMRNVDKEIEMVHAALTELEARFNEERAAFADACKAGVGSGELMNYQGFFELMQDKRAESQERLSALMMQKEKLAAILAKTHNELKVLANMKEEQYLAYCKEMAAEEAKELETNMAFSIFEKAV